MPLSFGIPIGLLIGGVGVILFFATHYKETAKTVIGVGVTITILTFGLMMLVLNTSM